MNPVGKREGWSCEQPDLLSPWDVSLLLLTVTQQLKNKKQTETEMLYGSTPRTPNKRRGMTPTTPGKVRKVRRLHGPLVTGRVEGGATPALAICPAGMGKGLWSLSVESI